MRHTIWAKDDFFPGPGGKKIAMTASKVQLPERPVSLVWSYDFNMPKSLLGAVSDLRTEDGEITGEVAWAEDGAMSDERFEELKDDLRFGGYYNKVEMNKAGTRVLHCGLRGVSMLLRSQVPGWSSY